MGLTQQEVIALIDQLDPPAQRIPALTGHALQLVRTNHDASAIELIDPGDIADSVTAEWAQPDQSPPRVMPAEAVFDVAIQFDSSDYPRVDGVTNSFPATGFIRPTSGGDWSTPTVDNWAVQEYPNVNALRVPLLSHFDNGSSTGHGTRFRLPYGDYTFEMRFSVTTGGDTGTAQPKAWFRLTGLGDSATDGWFNVVFAPDATGALTVTRKLSSSHSYVAFDFSLQYTGSLGNFGSMSLHVDSFKITRRD